MTLRAETKCLRACDSRAKVKTLNRYLRADLSPFCTHLIFWEHESDRLNFKAYLQRFLPHATTVMCGKNRDTMDTCISRARGGGQIILLKHTGFWCDQMALAVEDASLRGMPGHKHRSCLRVPANVMDYFLDFDVLKHSASHVADSITQKLSMAARSEQDIIGFRKAEKGRLLYTWQLVLTYKRTAWFLRWAEWVIGTAVILVAFGTTCCAVFVTGRTRGPIACGVMSVATGFLIAMERYLECGKKAAALELAKERITSEIYCYRSRTGDYSQGGSANQLQESLEAFKRWRDRRRDKRDYTRDIFAKWETTRHAHDVSKSLTQLDETSRFQSAMADEDDAEGARDVDDAAARRPADARNVRAARFQAEVREIERNLVDTALKSEPLLRGMDFDDYRQKYLYPQERWAATKKVVNTVVDAAYAGVDAADSVKSAATASVRGAWRTRKEGKRWAGWGARPADGAAPKVAPTWSDESDSEESDTDFVIVDPRFCVQHGRATKESDEAEDDGVALVTGDDYEKFRVAMELQRLRQLAHAYGRAQQGLEILRLSFVAAAAFAAIVARQDFVVVLIALGTAVSAFSTMIGGPQRVAMLLATCSELHRTRIWWYSLSTVEKRQLPHRERLVSETEAALDRLAGMWAVQSIRRARARDGPDGGGDDANAGKKADGTPLRRRGSRPTASAVPVAAGHQ